MKIAGTFGADEWPALRKRLKADESDAWQEAAILVRQRLGGRYLEHARELLDRAYSGFAILAIDCAVIEALEQFRKGAPSTPYRKSREYYKDFFTTTRFKKFFTEKTAAHFYDTVRCGILHQAESKVDSLVKKSTDSFVVRLSSSGAGVVINAKRFHEELEGALDDYVKALLSGDTALRTLFIKKMSHIARSQPDEGVVV